MLYPAELWALMSVSFYNTPKGWFQIVRLGGRPTSLGQGLKGGSQAQELVLVSLLLEGEFADKVPLL